MNIKITFLFQATVLMAPTVFSVATDATVSLKIVILHPGAPQEDVLQAGQGQHVTSVGSF